MMTNKKSQFQILTLNAWGEGRDNEHRWPVLCREVAQLKPDFAGFQEIFRAEQLELISKTMTFKDAFTPQFKTGLGLATQGEILKTGHFILPFSPIENYRRFLIMARVRFQDWEINFYNAHVSWQPEDHKSREMQSEAILGFVRAQPKADFDILTGDLNAASDTKSVQLLGLHFTDVYALFNPGADGYTWSHRNKYTLRAPELLERRIDYIMIGGLHGKKMVVKEAHTIFDKPMANDMWVSDHFGVYADVEISEHD